MTLSELLAQNPAAAAEVDKLKTDAKAEGRAELQAEMDKVSAKARPILESKAYGEGVKMLAVDCLTGKSSIVALEAAIAAVDLTTEAGRSALAVSETAAIGETGGQAPQGEANAVAKDAALVASFFKKDGK